MRWRRLGWAGVEIEAGEEPGEREESGSGESIVIDLMLDAGLLSAFYGEGREQLVAPEPGRARVALVTHLHRDHADAAAIEAALAAGAELLRPHPPEPPSELEAFSSGEAERELAATDVPQLSIRAGETIERGPFEITAVFASDGLGSPQVSWVVGVDGVRILHAGDTLWHGHWWEIAHLHGPIDVAFLPANGVEIDFPQLQPAVDEQAVMTPEQAVAAARALGAGLLVPIHFDATFVHPQLYRPVTEAAERLRAAAGDAGVELAITAPGEWQPAPKRTVPA